MALADALVLVPLLLFRGGLVGAGLKQREDGGKRSFVMMASGETKARAQKELDKGIGGIAELDTYLRLQ